MSYTNVSCCSTTTRGGNDNGSTRDAWSVTPSPVDPLTGLRRLLYLVTPAETSFAAIESVPNIIEECVPYFLLLMALEHAILTARGRRKSMPLNDSLTSIGLGIVSQLPLLFARSVEVSVYVWIHANWRLVDVPVDAAWSWLATLVAVDFCFYWVHRLTHEINLVWSAHQVHHSSERFNLTTAVRQSALQRYLVWLAYAPLALVLPPSLFAVHLQLNLVYQFWIHTQTIRRLPGPLEFVFNTPSHHRVHHGRNAYCIDRNYGGLFIVFDRLFGTFQAERLAEPPVFGLVTPVATLDPLELQTNHLKRLAIQLVDSRRSWRNRLGLLFCGPSWQPGLPGRLGAGVYPAIRYPVKPFNPSVPGLVSAYATAHFLAALAGYGYLTSNRDAAGPLVTLFGCLLVLWALSGVAKLLEGKLQLQFELARCLITAVVCYLVLGTSCTPVCAFYLASCGVCWLV